MLKQLIVTIIALVLMNSAINLALADEPIYNDSQNGYDSIQNVNENTEKDIIVSTNGVNDQDSGHYNNTISLDERMEAWEWF